MKKFLKGLAVSALALVLLTPGLAGAAEKVALQNALVLGDTAYAVELLESKADEINVAFNKELQKEKPVIYFVHPANATDLDGKVFDQKGQKVTLHKADGSTEQYVDGFRVDEAQPDDGTIKAKKPNIKVGWQSHTSEIQYQEDIARAALVNLPEDAKVSWLELPVMSMVKKNVPGTILVTLKDGTTQIVEVEIDVENAGNLLASKYEAKAKAKPVKVVNQKDIQTPKTGYPYELTLEDILDETFLKEAKDSIDEKTLKDEPEWLVEPNFANTSRGVLPCKVVVEYKDGSMDIVEVGVQTYENELEYAYALVKDGQAYKEGYTIYVHPEDQDNNITNAKDKNNFELNTNITLKIDKFLTDEFKGVIEEVTTSRFYTTDSKGGSKLPESIKNTVMIAKESKYGDGEYAVLLDLKFKNDARNSRLTAAPQEVKDSFRFPFEIKVAPLANIYDMSEFLNKKLFID